MVFSTAAEFQEAKGFGAVELGCRRWASWRASSGRSEVEVKTCDVGALIGEAEGAFDAILLDVDNGPDGLTRADNDVLYAEEGLQASRRALAPGGVLAVWSAAPDPGFSERLLRCGFDVSTHKVRAGHPKGGSRHTIWIAVRPGS
jgi:hypothetical protein